MWWIKKCLLLSGMLSLSGNSESGNSDLLQKLEAQNSILFDYSISGKNSEYWQRYPGMTSRGFIEYLANLYSRFTSIPKSASARIPLVVHQIWIGSDVPDRLKKFMDTWKNLPAPWHYQLWTDKEIEALNLINYTLYKQASNYAEKSDIARYEILSRYGGVYVDCDVELIRPENLSDFHYTYDLYAGLEQLSDQRTFSIGNSIIGCAPGNVIMAHMVENMQAWFSMCSDYYAQEVDHFIHKWEPTCLRTGPGYLSAMVYRYGPLASAEERVIIFEPDTFYAYEFTDDHEGIISRHKYDGSWLKKRRR